MSSTGDWSAPGVVNVRRYEGLNGTPALPLALRGWTDLVDRGMCRNVVMLFWDNWAVVAELDGTPVGVITFSKSDWLREFHISIGFVLPEYRRRGVYRAMWTDLVAWARELKFRAIEGSTKAENATMRSVAAALGRREDVTLHFELPEEQQPQPPPLKSPPSKTVIKGG